MKKILTILLSMLMVFSSCLMVSAGTGDIEVYQNANGDLMLKGNTDIGKDILSNVYTGDGERVKTQSSINVRANDLYSGTIENYHGTLWDGTEVDNVAIENEGDGLYKVSKDKLLEGGFVNGNCEFKFNVNGTTKYTTSYTVSGLRDVTPNMASSLTLDGKVATPIEGESTAIDASSLKLLDQNNNEISKDDYSICWAEKGVNGYGETVYRKTEDKTFDINKIYYLRVIYDYVYGKDDKTVSFNYKYGKLIEQTNAMGATGFNFMMTESEITFVMECTVGKAEVKTSHTNDLSKDLVEKVAIKNSANEVQNLVEVKETEQAAMDAGKNLEIQMSVNSQSNVSEDDVSKVETKVASDGLTKGAIYDIKMYKNIEGETEITAVTETKSDTVISFPLEDRLVNTDSSVNREYKVVRVHHEGDKSEVDILDATYDASTKSITFKTNKFSTYAICYKDTKKEEKKEETNTSSNTSSTKVVTCEEAMNSKNWMWSESKKACVYRVTNTSAK